MRIRFYQVLMTRLSNGLNCEHRIIATAHGLREAKHECAKAAEQAAKDYSAECQKEAFSHCYEVIMDDEQVLEFTVIHNELNLELS